MTARPSLFEAIAARDADAVRRALAAGANPQASENGETPLHAAARCGSLAVVEALIEGNALEWQTDAEGRSPLDVARAGRGEEHDAIVRMLDRRRIDDPSFRAAVDAIHRGDRARLEALLDADERLLRERIVEPEAYRKATRHQYFLDPKLFWFVANNPTRVDAMPENIVDIARSMIDRGVAQTDLDYTLELIMTNASARAAGYQRSLMRVLLSAGAAATDRAILTTAGHGQDEALRDLLRLGNPMTAVIAAALGEDGVLETLLAHATSPDVQDAFGIAVINEQPEATRIALDAGADVNARMPVHAHATALHTAAIGDDVALVELLLARGAHLEARDTLWDATPLEWAIHEGRLATRNRLERAMVP